MIYIIYYYRPDTKEFIFGESDKETIYKYKNGKITESSLYYPNSQMWNGSPYREVKFFVPRLKDVFLHRDILDLDIRQLHQTLNDFILMASDDDLSFILRWKTKRFIKQIIKEIIQKNKEFRRV